MIFNHAGRTTHIEAFSTRRQRMKGDGEVSIDIFQVDGKSGWRAKIEWEEVPDGASFYGDMPPGLFTIDGSEAQRLMDQLWESGCRPSAAAGSAGQLQSTLRHLEDMRAIAFKKSGVEKP